VEKYDGALRRAVPRSCADPSWRYRQPVEGLNEFGPGSQPLPIARRPELRLHSQHTKFDEAAGNISLEIDFGEGAAFHWGDLHISGRRETDKRELLRGWALRGKVYRGDPQIVLGKFFETYFRPLRPAVTPSNCAKWKIDEPS
jgi:hypothetical protein